MKTKEKTDIVKKNAKFIARFVNAGYEVRISNKTYAFNPIGETGITVWQDDEPVLFYINDGADMWSHKHYATADKIMLSEKEVGSGPTIFYDMHRGISEWNKLEKI